MKDLARCRQGSSSQKRGPNASEPGRIKLCQAKLKWQLEQRSRSDQLSHISQLPHRLSHQACRANLLTQMFGGARCHAYKRVPKFPFKGYPYLLNSCDDVVRNCTDKEIFCPPALVPGANLCLAFQFWERPVFKFNLENVTGFWRVKGIHD